MNKETATIKCEALFNKDKTHRYALTKSWGDDSKPFAVVISICPSVDYNIKTDLTCQLVTNNLYALGFSGFTLLNLFSKVGTDFKKVSNTADLYDKETDKMILSACEAADIIILAWGKISGKSKEIGKRASEVISMLAPYAEKMNFISDDSGRSELHPLTPSLRYSWNFSKYSLETEIPSGDWSGEIQPEQ